MKLTQKYLREALHYSPSTGVFTWLVRPKGHFDTLKGWTISTGKTAGRVAGSANTARLQLTVKLDGQQYQLHRLAFLYMEGEMPLEGVDHIDHNRQNNKWSNLRNADQALNNKNASRRKDNKSGCVGVHWAGDKHVWVAQINVDKVRTYLGQFEDFFEAVCARKSAEIRYGYHPNHGRVK